jgi:glycogen(starch) synthase
MPKMRILMIGPGTPNEANSGLGVAAFNLGENLSNHVSLTIVQPGEAETNLDKTLSTKTVEDVSTQKFSDSTLIQDLIHINVQAKLNPYFYFKAENEDQVEATQLSEVKEEWRTFTDKVVEVSKTIDFDVIYAHDWTTFAAGLALKKISDKPLVLHIHSLDLDRISSQHRSWVYDLERKAINEADAIIAVSNYTANIITSQYAGDSTKVHVVHSGYDHLGSIVPKNIFQAPIVLFVGRLSNQKGPHVFLEIAEHVLSSRHDVQFLVVGDGEMMGEMLESAAHKAISDRFHFTGFIDREKLAEAYSSASVYCMPSISEPFGLSAIEAADANLPMVLSKQSGAAEVLTAALTIDTDDIQGFSRAILSLLDDQKLAEKMAEENKLAIKGLSWEKAASEIANIFKSVIK